jgi:hypothetical protein
VKKFYVTAGAGGGGGGAPLSDGRDFRGGGGFFFGGSAKETRSLALLGLGGGAEAASRVMVTGRGTAIKRETKAAFDMLMMC